MIDDLLRKYSEISLYGVPPSNGPIDGYSYAGLKIAIALEELGFHVPWRDDTAPVSISFCQPEWYSQATGQFRIGYTPWESTLIPDWWPGMMNEMDLIWTTSHFCKDVFRNCGVEKDIIVVPHGISSEDFTIKKRQLDGDFYFFHMGEPATRKGGQLVVDAFIRLFDKDPTTHLVVKANGWAECRLRNPFGPIDAHPNIQLITEQYSVQQLNDLFHKVHALVYPSNGEGFGMIPFECIATGMPVAAVVWGGIEEFGRYCIPIDYSVGPSGHSYHLGEWAHPDFDAICEVMWDIRNNYGSYAERAFDMAQEVHKDFQWKDLISKALVASGAPEL